MLTITEAALQRLAEAIRRVNGIDSDDACFRLSLDEEGNLALAVDVPSPDDRTYQHNESTIVVMSAALAEHFSGQTLDVNAAGDFVLS